MSTRTASDALDINVTTVGCHKPTEPSGRISLVRIAEVLYKSARRSDDEPVNVDIRRGESRKMI